MENNEGYSSQERHGTHGEQFWHNLFSNIWGWLEGSWTAALLDLNSAGNEASSWGAKPSRVKEPFGDWCEKSSAGMTRSATRRLSCKLNVGTEWREDVGTA